MIQNEITNHFGESGAKNVNYYKVNRDENIIVFDSVPNYNIYLEYLSNGITLDEETKIPRRLFNALLSGVMYQLSLEDPTMPMGKTQMYGMEYRRQLDLVRASERGFTKDEFLDVIYKNSKQTPKR